MGKMVPVSTGEYKLPVYVSYTCAKCGKEVNLQEDIYVSCTLTGIDFDTANRILHSKLPDDTVKQIEHIAAFGKKHGFLMCYDPMASGSRLHKAIQFRCPGCKTLQVPDAGGKPASLVKGRGLNLSVILSYVLIIGWFVGMSIVLFQSPVKPINLLWVTLTAAAGGIGLVVYDKLSKKRAFRDPEFMFKKYSSIVNPSVYVDFSPYGLEKILMNSEK